MHLRSLFGRLYLRLSYRDPNLIATLDTYDRTADFLISADLNEAEFTRKIIGTIGEVDSYRLPDAKGFTSMQRYLIGDTDEARQRMREEILLTTAADIRTFADAMEEIDHDSSRNRAKFGSRKFTFKINIRSTGLSSACPDLIAARWLF